MPFDSLPAKEIPDDPKPKGHELPFVFRSFFVFCWIVFVITFSIYLMWNIGLLNTGR